MLELRVLVVEDDDFFRKALVGRLQRLNVDAHGVESGEEAIEAIKHKDFDVAVLDMKLPGMDGVDTLQQIKRIQPLIEVIILTGYASVGLGIEAMELGAFDYIMKPVDFHKLIDGIYRAAEKKSSD